MLAIRSPLGALGALMVLLQGIAAAALVPLESQPDLQRVIVWMMVVVTSAIVLVLVVVVLWFAFRNPGLLFNPKDISPEAHVPLYSPSARVPASLPQLPEGVDLSYQISDEDHEEKA